MVAGCGGTPVKRADTIHDERVYHRGTPGAVMPAGLLPLYRVRILSSWQPSDRLPGRDPCVGRGCISEERIIGVIRVRLRVVAFTALVLIFGILFPVGAL